MTKGYRFVLQQLTPASEAALTLAHLHPGFRCELKGDRDDHTRIYTALIGYGPGGANRDDAIYAAVNRGLKHLEAVAGYFTEGRLQHLKAHFEAEGWEEAYKEDRKPARDSIFRRVNWVFNHQHETYWPVMEAAVIEDQNDWHTGRAYAIPEGAIFDFGETARVNARALLRALMTREETGIDKVDIHIERETDYTRVIVFTHALTDEVGQFPKEDVELGIDLNARLFTLYFVPAEGVFRVKCHYLTELQVDQVAVSAGGAFLHTDDIRPVPKATYPLDELNPDWNANFSLARLGDHVTRALITGVHFQVKRAGAKMIPGDFSLPGVDIWRSVSETVHQNYAVHEVHLVRLRVEVHVAGRVVPCTIARHDLAIPCEDAAVEALIRDFLARNGIAARRSV